MPIVSIVIPAHNMAPWLGDTLCSVLAQTLVDWECLLVDDGSTDDTAARAKAFGDPRIQVISQAQGGVSAARNAGIAAAQSPFITFLDADDLWHPQALERLLAPLRADPDGTLSWANFLRFQDGTGRIMPLPSTRLQHTGNVWLDMLVDNFMPFGALCVRADVAKKQKFDPTLVIGEDRDWLLRVLKGAQAVHVPQVVHFYRQRASSAVRDTQRFLQDEALLMQRHLADPDVPARIRCRALAALDFHAAVLLAKQPGGWCSAFTRYLQGVVRDPLYLEHYLRPARKLFFRFRPVRLLSLPSYRKNGAATQAKETH